MFKVTGRIYGTALATMIVAASYIGGPSPSVVAQQEMETPPPELAILSKDVGSWECEIKIWPEPNAEPQLSKGSETNRMLGDFWLISEFQGDMLGFDYRGLGVYGYDREKKKYVGTWRDGVSSNVMDVEGTWDEKTETLTLSGVAPGPDGTPWIHTMTTSHKDNKRMMTMQMRAEKAEESANFKFFEITYSKP